MIFILLIAVLRVNSVSSDSDLYSPEFWQLSKTCLKIMLTGCIVGMFSVPTNGNSMGKVNIILNLFSIGIALSAFVFALSSFSEAWYISGWQLSTPILLICAQLYVLMRDRNAKSSYYLLLATYSILFKRLLNISIFAYFSSASERSLDLCCRHRSINSING